MAVFPEIILRKEFAGFRSDPYFKALEFLKGNDPSYKTVYVSTEAANIIKYRELCRVSSKMKESGFSKFMPVKGMMLLNTLFFDFPGIRQMADIDILVHPDEFGKVPELINRNNDFKYKSNFPLHIRKYFGEDISFYFNSTLVELHSRITLVKFPGLIEEIFEKSEEKKNPDKETFSAPPLEYAAIIMLLHDYSRDDLVDLTFKRLLEFYIVIYSCDLKKIKGIAQKYGLHTMLNCHLFLIWTMLENTFFDRYDFKIIEEFGFIERHATLNSFKVSKPSKLRKAVYGKRWKYLKMRNIAAGAFKFAIGKKD
jgi:hypothetical protein